MAYGFYSGGGFGLFPPFLYPIVLIYAFWMVDPLVTILILFCIGFLAYMFIIQPDWIHKNISELFSTPDVKDPKNPTEEEIKKIQSEYRVGE